VKALAISFIAGAALCVVSTPASAMPAANLAVAASDLALHQSVPWVRQPHWEYSPGRGWYRQQYSYYEYSPRYEYSPGRGWYRRRW
jgi:hypothetical protein